MSLTTAQTWLALGGAAVGVGIVLLVLLAVCDRIEAAVRRHDAKVKARVQEQRRRLRRRVDRMRDAEMNGDLDGWDRREKRA